MERFDFADPALKKMLADAGAMGTRKKQLDPAQRKMLRKQSALDIRRLNLAWVDQMVTGEDQLREKMALFWHGHFATRDVNIFYQQDLIDVIRRGALGSFRDLLREASKSAAMINFLNNNQNRKEHPNENFARESMELFTLGRGNYTEHDVREAARAFTGWGASPDGHFEFRERTHDEGEKTVFGKTGRFTGDDMVDLLLERPETALFLCRKIYRFFVNERVNELRVAWLAARFQKDDYRMMGLLRDIFTSDWFYEPENVGSHIKSPVEWLVGIRRMLPLEMENPEGQVLVQRLLGQLLFYPPNVAGWPGGENWIDSSTLLLRLRLPSAIAGGDLPAMRPKDDDDQMMGLGEEPDAAGRRMRGDDANRKLRCRIDWSAFESHFAGVPDDRLTAALGGLLWQTPALPDPALLRGFTDASSREALLRTTAIRLMSTPEYQLC